MKGCLVAGGVAVLLAIVVGLMAMGMYNGVVDKDEACKKAWGNVESVLQRRFDLIPNLVNTVKGYAQHEKGILEEITRLRSQWGEAKSTSEKVEAASGLEGALSRLMVVVENYPDLKANTNFQQLQDELAGTENRIAVARKDYNDAVQSYNAKIKSLPTSLYAGAFGFTAKDYFKADAAAQKVPQVKF